jgi:hypothetical protein
MGPRLREDDGYVSRHGALPWFLPLPLSLPPSVNTAPSILPDAHPSFLRRQESIPAPAPRFTADGSPPSRGRRICFPSWRFTVVPAPSVIPAPFRYPCPLPLILPPPSFLTPIRHSCAGRNPSPAPAPASITPIGSKARLPKPNHGVYADILYGLDVYTFAHKPACRSLLMGLHNPPLGDLDG